MPAPINKHQPTRPEKSENGQKLLYRVSPIIQDDNGQRSYRTHEPANRLAQMQLYRWCRSPDFIQMSSCAELHEILIEEPFQRFRYKPSKNHFGRTIINAVDYDPRKLKGKSKLVEKVQQVYYFHEREDLQYGLEYMICAWLRKFLNDSSAPGEQLLSGPQMMGEELDILANTDWDDYVGLYVLPLKDIDRTKVEEPDWRELAKEAVPILDDEINHHQKSKRKLTRFVDLDGD